MTTSTDAAAGRSGPLAARPGKIIAVHLSYASRADQRGRRPAAPSYFFKPSSSVAASGGTIERPAGTELLAFEGEIALVIGDPARRVPLADAWAHVAYVTASNDFGLYDLRANDKGSNLRSKGGDGFTPIGPTLLDASEIDPGAIRVRTWVNGAIAQDDTTAGLICFPNMISSPPNVIRADHSLSEQPEAPRPEEAVRHGNTLTARVPARSTSPRRAEHTLRHSPPQINPVTDRIRNGW